MENLCDFMMPRTLYIYTSYSTEWVGFFLFATMYATHFNLKNRFLSYTFSQPVQA